MMNVNAFETLNGLPYLLLLYLSFRFEKLALSVWMGGGVAYYRLDFYFESNDKCKLQIFLNKLFKNFLMITFLAYPVQNQHVLNTPSMKEPNKGNFIIFSITVGM